MKKVLFDLDGTLIDSAEGITKGVQYTLREYLGIDEPDLQSLTCFIGPPLALMFAQKYGVPAEKIEPAVAKYREYYDTVGWKQCRVYDGVEALLKNLKKKGFVLGVASSKPECSCEQILEEQGLAGYFDEIAGASMGPERREKALVLEHAFRRMGVSDRSEIVLVGDTKYDAVGAAKAGIDCIGVTYGFGTREELLAAGAAAVFDTTEELEAFLYECE